MTDYDPVAWVYNLEDYLQIFALDEADLNKSILEYPAGIACFNAEMHAKGKSVCSGDDFYDVELPEMVKRAEAILQRNRQYLQNHPQRLNAAVDCSVEQVVSQWQKNSECFLDDFQEGKQQQRYQRFYLPKLPFTTHYFDLALCSDLVFHTRLYPDNQPDEVIMELCRVAREVRIFPLLDEHGDISDQLGPAMLNLQQQNFGVEIKEVPYQLLAGSNAMLRVWVTECKVTA